MIIKYDVVICIKGGTCRVWCISCSRDHPVCEICL